MAKSPKLIIKGVPIIFTKVNHAPGVKTIKLLVKDVEVSFTVTPSTASIIQGDVPPEILPVLIDHLQTYHRPRPLKIQ